MKNERGNVAVIVIAVIALLATPFIIWALTVASSDTVGEGNAIIKKNSSTNRVSAQERFEDLYADIVATDAKIATAKDAVKANPDSQVAQTNLTGLVNYCVDVVGDYNAEARKYSSEDFRSIDLPEQIDSTDASTDCK